MTTLLIVFGVILFIPFLLKTMLKGMVQYINRVMPAYLEKKWQEAIHSSDPKSEKFKKGFLHSPNKTGVTFAVWLERAGINQKDLKAEHVYSWINNESPLRFTKSWEHLNK